MKDEGRRLEEETRRGGEKKLKVRYERVWRKENKPVS